MLRAKVIIERCFPLRNFVTRSCCNVLPHKENPNIYLSKRRAAGLVIHVEHEIHVRCAGQREFVPRLRVHVVSRICDLAQRLAGAQKQ